MRRNERKTTCFKTVPPASAPQAPALGGVSRLLLILYVERLKVGVSRSLVDMVGLFSRRIASPLSIYDLLPDNFARGSIITSESGFVLRMFVTGDESFSIDLC